MKVPSLPSVLIMLTILKSLTIICQVVLGHVQCLPALANHGDKHARRQHCCLGPLIAGPLASGILRERGY